MQAVLQNGLELLKCAPIEVLPAEIRNETIDERDAISSSQVPQTTRAVTMGDAAREAMASVSDAIQRGVLGPANCDWARSWPKHRIRNTAAHGAATGNGWLAAKLVGGHRAVCAFRSVPRDDGDN